MKMCECDDNKRGNIENISGKMLKWIKIKLVKKENLRGRAIDFFI